MIYPEGFNSPRQSKRSIILCYFIYYDSYYPFNAPLSRLNAVNGIIKKLRYSGAFLLLKVSYYLS